MQHLIEAELEYWRNFFWVGVVVWALIWGAFCAVLANQRNRDPFGWLVLGGLFALPAMLLLGFLNPLPEEKGPVTGKGFGVRREEAILMLQRPDGVTMSDLCGRFKCPPSAVESLFEELRREGRPVQTNSGGPFPRYFMPTRHIL